MLTPPRVLPAGDRALVVEYGATIDAQVNARVRGLAATLDATALPGIIETVPTYRSLMVHYDPLRLAVSDLERILLTADAGLLDEAVPERRTVEMPVVYGGEFGPDLADVAAHHGLSEDDVVAIHAASDYLIFMMGFMPGFPYLGGLSPRIATPRLSTPRTVVPAGSVGIAGQQTGIYPTDSPGGWRLIGRTPVRLFDTARTPPVLFEAGDYLRFIPVSARESAEIARRVASGAFAPVIRVERTQPS
jgi:KipI family sensor histidine kinase inhibitor